MSVLDIRNLIPVSFNGNNINDWSDATKTGSYRSMIPMGAPTEAPAKPIFTERNDNTPIYSGKHFTGRTLPLKIEVKNGSASALSTLMGWFDSLDTLGPYKLIVKNDNAAPHNGDGSTWYCYAVVVEAPKFEPPYTLSITLAIADTNWRSTTNNSDAWSVTASGQTRNLTVGGNQFFRPKFTLTPTGFKTSNPYYGRYILVYNQSPNQAVNYYLDVSGQVGKGLNTSALISDSTVSNQLNGGITSGATTIAINTPVGGGLPGVGMGYIIDGVNGNEQISWTANSGSSLTGVTRGLGGTTAVLHPTASVVRRSKMLANANDVFLSIDGNPTTNIWYTGLNGATTGLHIPINFSAGLIFTLNIAIASSGAVTTIAVPKTAANKTALGSLNAVHNKILAIASGGGTEIFAFTGVDTVGDANNYYITGVTRHVNDDGSSTFGMVAHAVGDKIFWVEHPAWLIYGNAAAQTPDVDQTKKPLQDLTNSTNNSWVEAAFYDANSARPGAWVPHHFATLSPPGSPTFSWTYTGDLSAGAASKWANPATELGMQMLAFQVSNVWRAESASEVWQFWHPFGITSVTCSGKKYCLSTSFPSVCGLYKQDAYGNLLQVWNETAPAANTWTALSVNGTPKTLSGTYNLIRFWLYGNLAAIASDEADVQMDTITMALDTTTRPVVVMGAELANYFLSATITNTTGASDPYNGWVLTIVFPMQLNNSLVIDCEARTIQYLDGSGNLLQVVPAVAPVFTKSPARSDWMCISPGTSQLTYVDAGTNGVTFTTAWNDRSV